MNKVTLEVFVMQCVEDSSLYSMKPGDIKADLSDYLLRIKESDRHLYGRFILVDQVTVEVPFTPLPTETVAGIVLEGLQEELNALNAKHHVATERIKDQMSKWQLLAGPAEGELMPIGSKFDGEDIIDVN